MISEKALRIAGAELQELMVFDPPIDVKASVADLTEQVRGAIKELREDDVLTKGTQAVVDELKKEVEPAEEVPNPPTLEEEVEAAESRSELIEIAKANDEFKSIRGKLSSYKTSKDLKAVMQEVLTADAGAAQETAEEIHEKNVATAPVRTGGRTASPVEKEKSKVTKERFAAKKSTGKERVDFLTPLIKAGKYTKAELVEKATVEFPDVSVSTLQTMLTDAKNPKYNKFDKLVVQGENGVLSFSK